MDWKELIVCAWLGLTAINKVATVGKPRPVITPGVAASCVLIYAALIWLDLS